MKRLLQVNKESAIRELTVERLAAGGDGVGFVDGKVCFVPYTAPADRASVHIVHSAKRFLRGTVETLVEPGPSRRTPECALFGVCGGCNWLHLIESEQLRAKGETAARALGFDTVETVPSPKSLGYRGPARLHFRTNADKDARLGFIDSNHSDIVNVLQCPILAPRLNQCLYALKEALQKQDEPLQGEIRLANGRTGACACFLVKDTAPPSFYRALSELSRDLFSGVTLSAGGIETTVFGNPIIEVDGADGQPFFAPASSFAQANEGINRAVAATVRRWLAERKLCRAVELFCGAGNLTVSIAPFVQSMTASELDEEACRQAKVNLKNRGMSHVSVISGDAPKVYEQYHRDADLLVLNPPRTGHLETARAAAKKGPARVLYISCNPATLSRDIAELKRSSYRITETTGFDMFPQTSHMEVAVLLER